MLNISSVPFMYSAEMVSRKGLAKVAKAGVLLSGLCDTSASFAGTFPHKSRKDRKKTA